MPRPVIASRTIAWSCAMGLFVLACAVSVPPSGGPEDKTPPLVTGSVPSPDSAGVGSGTSIAITFSEPMTQTGIERTLRFSPPIEYGKIGWKGQTLIITPAKPLHPDTTYVVTLDAGYRDAHGVPSARGYQLAFATSAALDTARIEGTIYFRREPTASAVVRCFRLPRDSAFTAAAGKPDRESVTDDEGAYTLRYLSARGDSFLVWAFEDKNKNGTFEPTSEYGMAFADTIVLTSEIPVARDIEIVIIDPSEPGRVEGRVENTSGVDSVAVTVTLAAAVDTLRARYITRAVAQGKYAFENVRPGTYALAAFVDLLADSLCGSYPCGVDSSATCLEPCVVVADSIVVAPGETAMVPLLTLPPAAKENP